MPLLSYLLIPYYLCERRVSWVFPENVVGGNVLGSYLVDLSSLSEPSDSFLNTMLQKFWNHHFIDCRPSWWPSFKVTSQQTVRSGILLEHWILWVPTSMKLCPILTYILPFSSSRSLKFTSIRISLVLSRKYYSACRLSSVCKLDSSRIGIDLLLRLCLSYQPDSHEGPLAWRQLAIVKLILRRIELPCKAQASGNGLVQPSGSYCLDKKDKNSASVHLKHSGRVGKMFSGFCPLFTQLSQSQASGSYSLPARVPAMIHKTYQGCVPNLLCSSSAVAGLLSWTQLGFPKELSVR